MTPPRRPRHKPPARRNAAAKAAAAPHAHSFVPLSSAGAPAFSGNGADTNLMSASQYNISFIHQAACLPVDMPMPAASPFSNYAQQDASAQFGAGSYSPSAEAPQATCWDVLAPQHVAQPQQQYGMHKRRASEGLAYDAAPPGSPLKRFKSADCGTGGACHMFAYLATWIYVTNTTPAVSYAVMFTTAVCFGTWSPCHPFTAQGAWATEVPDKVAWMHACISGCSALSWPITCSPLGHSMCRAYVCKWQHSQ